MVSIVVSTDNVGVIQTCSGWKLNFYPVLKSFIKEPGGIDTCENLSVEYIHKHNPDLVIYEIVNDEKVEVERIDLKKHKKLTEIRTLLKEKGIQCNSDCIDISEDCKYWYENGECESNPSFMKTTCPFSCKLCNNDCKDLNSDCGYWSKNGECEQNPTFMSAECPFSCQLCEPTNTNKLTKNEL